MTRDVEEVAGLALFGKKKNDDEGGGAEDNGKAKEPEFFPEKARKFFEHAQTAHDTGRHEYAMTLWLNGLRQDPTSLAGLEKFFRSAASFLANGKGKISKETLKNFSGSGSDLERYLGALLKWGLKPTDAVASLRSAELAAKLEIGEPVYWIAERTFALLQRPDAKARKDQFIKLMEVFGTVGAYNEAAAAGDQACRLDPSNGDLATRVRNMQAQATMSSGGYENSGQEGGFRQNIRDASKQRQLEEEERVVKTEETIDRLIDAAEKELVERPGDIPTINKLGKALLQRGRSEDEERARRMFLKAYEDTNQYRFRQAAGDIRLRQARRKLGEYRARAEATDADDRARELFAKANTEFRRMEIEEFRERVENYPTDLGLKFELGRRHFEAEQYDEAIPLFQEAQHDKRYRNHVLNMLGQSFAAIDFLDEAIGTLGRAVEQLEDASSEIGMELRYNLMRVLRRKAEDERDLASAQKAEELASQIAIAQLNFRDIRTHREELKKLVQDLRA
ncbi:MAG: hypothetical protein KDA28_11585 [Phycisphaerales bacterium]|nr:hypothetical protein [Phycisphaerales bacterium]